MLSRLPGSDVTPERAVRGISAVRFAPVLPLLEDRVRDQLREIGAPTTRWPTRLDGRSLRRSTAASSSGQNEKPSPESRVHDSPPSGVTMLSMRPGVIARIGPLLAEHREELEQTAWTVPLVDGFAHILERDEMWSFR